MIAIVERCLVCSAFNSFVANRNPKKKISETKINQLCVYY